MLGRQPVVHQQQRATASRDQVARLRVIVVQRANHPAATVQVDDEPLRTGLRPEQAPRHGAVPRRDDKLRNLADLRPLAEHRGARGNDRAGHGGCAIGQLRAAAQSHGFQHFHNDGMKRHGAFLLTTNVLTSRGAGQVSRMM